MHKTSRLPNQITVARYVRVSTTEQADKKTYETQISALDTHCDNNHYQVYDTYLDDGVSGVAPFSKRSAGARLLRDARQGLFDLVLVYKLDRLGRSVVLVYEVVDELMSLGVEFAATSQPFDTTTTFGRAVFGLLAIFAELERDMIKERTHGGKLRVAEEGKWPGGPLPFGYATDAESRLVPNEIILPCGHSEAGIIRLIYECVIELRLSLQGICDYLTARAIPSPAYCRTLRQSKKKPSPHWRSSTVAKLIASPIYRGEHHYGHVVRTVPSLISEPQWRLAQEIIEKRRKFCGRGGSIPFLLRNLIHCGNCGRKYHGATYRYGRKLEEGRWFYRCSGLSHSKQLGCNCKNPDIDGPSLEEGIWRELVRMAVHRQETLEEIARKQQVARGAAADRLRDLDQVRHEISRKEDERRRINSAFRKGSLTEEEFEEQKAEMAAEESTLLEQLVAAEYAWQRAQDSEDEMVRAASALDLIAEIATRTPSFQEKRAIIEAAVLSVTVIRSETGKALANTRILPLLQPDVSGSPAHWYRRPCFIAHWWLDREIRTA